MHTIEVNCWRRWVRSLFQSRTVPFSKKSLRIPQFDCLEDRSVPASITGLAFLDFNANGSFDTTNTLANASGGSIQTAIDVGVGGVTVSAYDSTNALVATTTSGIDGTYTLPGLTSGTIYRVQFTNLPPGFSPGPIGPNSGSTVQFATGDTANVDVGLVEPNQFSADNPTLVSTLFAAGDPINGSNSNNRVVMSLPYTGGGTTNDSSAPTATTLATASQVGAVLGIATSRQTGMVYVAAYTKIHAGYGPNVAGFSGNGSIDAIDPATNAVSVLVNLNQLFGANFSGFDFRSGYLPGDAAYAEDSVLTDGAYADSTGTYTSWDAVGKTAFGGMAISDDGSTLYAMNLANRSLYAIPLNLGRAIVAADVQSVSIPFNAPGATDTNGGTQAGDLQPFAVTFHHGNLFVGIVNSAESTQQKTDLHAYVYQVDPSTLAFGANPVFSITDMTYSRDHSARFAGTGFADWNPWTPRYRNISGRGLVYPQPMLTGIAFDAAGNMTLGFRDRTGDQGGDFALANPDSPNTTYETYPAGETLRAFGSLPTGWILEKSGKGPGGSPAGNVNGSTYGPGGGQFYQQDYSPSGGHGYIETGSVAQMPGFPDIVAAGYDPFLFGSFRTGGLRFNNTSNGQIDKAYQLYFLDQQGTFGKANGVGGVAFINTPAPIEIGNYVWNDTNDDGIQNAGETGIPNVTVHLVNARGGIIATAITDSTGQYRFSSSIGIDTPSAKYGLNLSANTTYTVRLDHGADFTSGPLKDLIPSPNRSGSDTSIDSDGVVVSSTDIRATVTTGQPGQNDHSIDFGFAPAGLSLGNFVWKDVNNNGTVDGTETGIANVSVSLLDNIGFVVASTTTNGQGNYLFTNLNPGLYQVRINASNFAAGAPLFGYLSSTGTNGSATGTYEPNAQGLGGDGTDHGTAQASGAVLGSIVTLSVGGETPGQPITPGITDPAIDGNRDVSQDFGFFQPLSLGNFVWNDVNNDGVVNLFETGLANVAVSLLDNLGNVITTTNTTAAGYYLFTHLAPGQYRVSIDASNFAVGGSLFGYVSSTGANGSATGTYEPALAGLGNDSTDHGTTQPSGSVIGSLISLTVGGQTKGQVKTPGFIDPALDGNRDVTQDFGFFQPLSLGNFVWNDVNNNGAVDNGETGIANVTVSLVDSTNAVIGTTTTDATGQYLFPDMIPGTYHIVVTPPANFISSTGTNGSASGPFEPGVSGTQDDQDHGTMNGSVVTGPDVTLAVTGSSSNPDNNGTANLRQDFGLFQPLSLGNFVFYDKNNNGVFDAGDSPLNGVSVQLRDTGGNVVGTQSTDTNGNYLFTNLIPGTYSVTLTPINNLISSTGKAGSPVGPFEPAVVTGTDNSDHGTTNGSFIVASGIVLGNPGDTAKNPTDSGFSNTTIDFGLTDRVDLGQVSGNVYLDPNINGNKEPGERSIPGVIVTLTGTDLNGNPVAKTTSTDTNGYYQFTNLLQGNYTITETQPTGLLYDGLDSIGSLGGSEPVKNALAVSLPINGNGINYNFGEIPPSQVTGYVYEDLNQNNSFDPGEPGISNVTISIAGTAFAGSPLARPLAAADSPNGLSIATDANGRWNFYGLPPGNYTVTETQPTVYDTLYNSSADKTGLPVTVGGRFNDTFSGILAPPDTSRGNLNFGEILPQNIVPTKRSFLSSSGAGNGSAGGVGQAVGLNPTFPPPGSGTAANPTIVAVGSGPGQIPLVRVFNYTGGYQQNQFEAYESSYTGGVRVAVADVNGDGIPDIVTGTQSGGGPRVRVFSGSNGTVLYDFFAYESSDRGGLFIAAGDIDGDGKADLIVSADTGGGPRVRAFSGADGSVLRDFFAFDSNMRTSVRVAVGDVNGDGKADIIATTGAGTVTTVRTYDGTNASLINTFQPFGSFTGGAYVAAGNTSGGIKSNIIVTPDAGGGPVIATFDGQTGSSLAASFAYDSSSRSGVRVAAADVNGDGVADVIVAPGPGTPSHVKLFSGANLNVMIDTFYAFDTTFLGGTYVA